MSANAAATPFVTLENRRLASNSLCFLRVMPDFIRHPGVLSNVAGFRLSPE